MPRYFLEVSYKGSQYSGFQKQVNANTIQAEVEKAFAVLQRDNINLTGSSRTDAGVHALQNFFHFDYNKPIHPQFIYKINAILPADIVTVSIQPVPEEAHCRFDAAGRRYQYCLYQGKDPFLEDRAYYYPYKIDLEKLNAAAAVIMEYSDFSSFSKRNTQVKSYLCNIRQSEWEQREKLVVYTVQSNRFLRGMVRGLTATMLQVGRGKISIEELRRIIEAKNCSEADFAAPAKGLFLVEVQFPETILAPYLI